MHKNALRTTSFAKLMLLLLINLDTTKSSKLRAIIFWYKVYQNQSMKSLYIRIWLSDTGILQLMALNLLSVIEWEKKVKNNSFHALLSPTKKSISKYFCY